jgi:hypothetical protein
MANHETRRVETTHRLETLAAGDGEPLLDADAELETAALELEGAEAPLEAAPPDGLAAAALAQASGVYVREHAPPDVYEELRIDIDGRYPQKMASGTVYRPASRRMHWAARLRRTGPNRWAGPIIFDRAPFPFRWTRVEIRLTRSQVASQQRAELRMLLPGGSPRVRRFVFSAPWFRWRPVHFEFDWEQNRQPVVQIDTCAHPDRPASLPCRQLTVEKVYERAGMNVRVTPGGPVPITAAGIKPTWSDFELHDAMEVYWSRFAPKTQWAMWTFFAGLHDDLPPLFPGEPPVPGEFLLGIMFDSGLVHAGPEERQGSAIFTDALAQAQPGGPHSAAWLKRETFYTTVHEMGHAFNLAHSFQKSLQAPGLGEGWIPLNDEPEARSFMNYPSTVRGGESAFYKRFHYRFSDQELAFMRHARPVAVRPGGVPFFTEHGFVEAPDAADLDPALAPGVRLDLRANREPRIYEFMEPVALELKLTNVSGEPRLVDSQPLSGGEALSVIVQRERQPARQFLPYAQRCFKRRKTVLEPERSMYAPLRPSAGLGGWEIADPGRYTVQVTLRLDGQEVVSNALTLRVLPPRSYEEERLGQEFFSDEVGRILAFNGSQVLDSGNNVLREVTERMEDRRAALHARLALGNVAARDTKLVKPAEGEHDSRMQIAVDEAKPEEGQKLLESALLEEPERAAESFGHIRYKRQVDSLSELLGERGETREAARAQDVLYDALSRRQVGGRPVLEPVLREVEERRENYRRE